MVGGESGIYGQVVKDRFLISVYWDKGKFRGMEFKG